MCLLNWQLHLRLNAVVTIVFSSLEIYPIWFSLLMTHLHPLNIQTLTEVNALNKYWHDFWFSGVFMREKGSTSVEKRWSESKANVKNFILQCLNLWVVSWKWWKWATKIEREINKMKTTWTPDSMSFENNMNYLTKELNYKVLLPRQHVVFHLLTYKLDKADGQDRTWTSSLLKC